MTTQTTDRFAMSVISLAFALKNLVESKYYDEGQHKLVQDFARLKERVQVQTKLLEQRQTAERVKELQRRCA